MGSASDAPEHVNVIVIGSGFGGAMTSLPIADAFKKRAQGERVKILERGTWWTTPVGTVQDPEVATAGHLRSNGQPVQYWSAINHFRGVLDIVLRCVRRPKNEDGLYDFTFFGRTGFLGLFGRRSDGVNILRATGVGGGSLVYSNVTIRPPGFVFEDSRWPAWPSRDQDFALAAKAIGLGVLKAIDVHNTAAYPGLHQIVTRSAGIDPGGSEPASDSNPSGKTRRVPPLPDAAGPWVDRARVFQRAMAELTDDYGTVDSSIADLKVGAQFEPKDPPDPANPPHNYCERQGRCNVGCLPGARFTLNKQFMVALYGKPPLTPPPPDAAPTTGPLASFLSIEPLAEVDVIVPLPGAGYEVRYVVRDPQQPQKTTTKTITAQSVILAAGCVGTTEILLRSKAKGHLPGLSGTLGSHFSTNGDYLAFLEGTEKNVNLVRGPATTSFAHFQTPAAGAKGGTDSTHFHTIEDQGVPPAFASLTGMGVPFIQKIGNATGPKLFVLFLILRWLFHRFTGFVKATWNLPRRRTEFFQSPEEQTSKIMCIAAMGREASVGRFRLGGPGDSPLRVARDDGRAFHEDPIYDDIRGSLARLAEKLLPPQGPRKQFFNPFLTSAANALAAKSITLTHALGGCPMGVDATKGVVDPQGQVFDASGAGGPGVYPGLYVADASMIPTALGVNPSLTISALALRVARSIVTDITGSVPSW